MNPREKGYATWFVNHPLRCKIMEDMTIIWVIGCTWRWGKKHFNHMPINYN